MAKKTIRIDLTKKGDINRVIKTLRFINYSNTYKSADMVNTMCEKIRSYAEMNFATAQYDGVNDVRCYFSKTSADYDVVRKYQDFEGAFYRNSNKELTQDSGYFAERKVVFEGASLYFIEFGTGVHYNPSGSSHEWLHSYGAVGKAFKKIHAIGTYGQGKGKHDAWVYYGEAGTNGSVFNSDPTKVLTHGNPPNRCIFKAVQEAKKEVLTTFRKARRII